MMHNSNLKSSHFENQFLAYQNLNTQTNPHRQQSQKIKMCSLNKLQNVKDKQCQIKIQKQLENYSKEKTENLMKNKYLGYIFEHYCNKMQKTSNQYFQLDNQWRNMINLNKWMLFCKDFELVQSFQTKNKQFQHKFMKNKKSQNLKLLMKVFYNVSNYKTKINFSQFASAIINLFIHFSSTNQNNEGIIESKIRIIQDKLFINEANRFKFICQKIHLLRHSQQFNKKKFSMKNAGKKSNKTQENTTRQQAKIVQKKRNMSLNSAKRPSLKALFQQNPYQMNRIVKLANEQLSKFDKYYSYSNKYSSSVKLKKKNSYSKRFFLSGLQNQSQKSLTKQKQDQFSHILSDRKYIQNIIPTNQKNNQEKNTKFLKKQKEDKSLSFSRLLQTIQLEKDQLLQNQLQMQKNSDKYMLQQRVFMKLDQQLSKVKQTCKKKLQLTVLRQ